MMYGYRWANWCPAHPGVYMVRVKDQDEPIYAQFDGCKWNVPGVQYHLHEVGPK